jgi:hypothetical protein
MADDWTSSRVVIDVKKVLYQGSEERSDPGWALPGPGSRFLLRLSEAQSLSL